MCGGVRGRIGGGVWFPHGNCMCDVCARVVWVKDRVGGGDWLLRIKCTCGESVVCGRVGVREGIRAC